MNCPSSNQDLPRHILKSSSRIIPAMLYFNIWTRGPAHSYSIPAYIITPEAVLLEVRTHSDSLLISHHCSFKYQRITWRSRNHFFTIYYLCITFIKEKTLSEDFCHSWLPTCSQYISDGMAPSGAHFLWQKERQLLQRARSGYNIVSSIPFKWVYSQHYLFGMKLWGTNTFRINN